MLIIPLILTVLIMVASYYRFNAQREVLFWSLVPMWTCYIAIAICDVAQIL